MGLDSVVIGGGGISGLLAAAAASPFARQVVIVEKDEIPVEPAPRRGVPQGRQVHALLGAGQDAMAELLPGIVDDFEAAGARMVDSPADLAVYGRFGWAGRVRSGTRTVMMRRPVLEHVVRDRVLALPNVTLRSSAVTGISVTDDRSRVAGFALLDGTTLEGDLVVDATGRVSRSVEWLGDIGYDAPQEREMRSHIGYATVEVRLPDGVFDDGVAGVLAHPHPGNCRGAAVVPADNGIYLIAGLGMMNQDPPRDIDGFMAHLDGAPSPIVGEIARKAEFLTDIATYRVRGSRRRVWEDLTHRPDGYLLIGDAVMAFNPLYGQGMSVAACEAVALSRSLSEDSSAAGLASRAQTAMKEVIDIVFAMAVSTDGAYEGAELIGVPRPSADDMEAGALLSRVATDDPEVALAVKRYAHYFDRGALQSPSIADKLAAWKVGNRKVLHDNPVVVPGIIG
ncbi:NAD(P)/FAD-dependent oxidoreductase [Rhodococcus sp. NCIMB 12038]|uniref:FAD-dependent oxidoreductase n=1 Tax=Rhodococcus sp. NCIMB 12038 TaxID=933800 RepID=UPI000B3CC583|nr:FAD-dependent monooxygenase [Rhodococcus sp. NCIMB 12038]OUS96338.1 FAD-binding protein [Rhodococcus sp. NCIMB 12038]